MTRGHRGSLLLRCRALSSPSPCRFIPAHPQFPPPPSERSAPPTPRSSSGLQFQALNPVHGLRRERRGSALPLPTASGGHTNGAAGFASRYGPLSRSPSRAFDAGLRPGPSPGRAAGLLPGPLAATRTGLSPAGGDELMLDQVISIDHLQRWAHSLSCCKFAAAQVPGGGQSMRRSPPRRWLVGFPRV
jgi:hypothetical protein